MFTYFCSPSYFYAYLLPSITTEEDREICIKDFEMLAESLISHLSYMKVSKINHPRHFQQLKHNLTQTEIYITDLANFELP